MASKSDGLLEYESVLDALVGTLVNENGLLRPKEAKQTPFSSSPDSSGPVNKNSEQSSNSSAVYVAKTKNTETNKERSGFNVTTEMQSSEVIYQIFCIL